MVGLHPAGRDGPNMAGSIYFLHPKPGFLRNETEKISTLFTLSSIDEDDSTVYQHEDGLLRVGLLMNT